MGLSNHSYGFEYVEESGLLWRWNARVNVSGRRAVFEIRDVITPWGPLRDSIALPGAVVTQMATTVEDLQSQFAAVMVIGPPTALSFIVDEGRGLSDPQGVAVTNSGPIGSLLDAGVVSSAEEMLISTPRLAGLASGQSGELTVRVDSTELDANMSPLGATVTFESDDGPSFDLPVDITIRPRAVTDLSVTELRFSVSVGSIIVSPSQATVLTNQGPAGSVLDYELHPDTDDTWSRPTLWDVDITPDAGTLLSLEQASLDVSVQMDQPLPPGTYVQDFVVHGYSEGPATLRVLLEVSS
jgi:hypothetical protein